MNNFEIKNQYGRSMIEMLGVFTLLGIILLIAIPKITSMLKKNNIESYESFEKTVFIATEAYIIDNKIVIAKESSTMINLSDIIASGSLKSNLVDPNNNTKIKDMKEAKVQVIKDSNGILSYKFIES